MLKSRLWEQNHLDMNLSSATITYQSGIWSWTCFSTSLYLCFLICKMGVTAALTSLDCWEGLNEQILDKPSTWWVLHKDELLQLSEHNRFLEVCRLATDETTTLRSSLKKKKKNPKQNIRLRHSSISLLWNKVLPWNGVLTVGNPLQIWVHFHLWKIG